MSRLCADVGYKSLIKYGEQLCGDHVDVVEQDDGTITVVLADGLGSGVKANILSTLTSKIISTMMCNDMTIDNCVTTIASTLPVCEERKVAYCTFTIIRILNTNEAHIIQYDNPLTILIRDGENVDYPKEEINIDGKKIYFSKIPIYEGDVFILLSDGAINAGTEKNLNLDWERKDIIEYMKTFFYVGFTAKTLTTILLDECNKLYGYRAYDDTTVCTLKIIKRNPVNILIGPPINDDDDLKMMSLFFSKAGKHIVCGGTTAKLAGKYLREDIVYSSQIIDKNIPPISEIKGVDLVTEGIITISRVLEYAKDYLGTNSKYKDWSYKKDAASMISRILFEEATDINLFIGKAQNPAHQNPKLPIEFNIKMNILNELIENLKKMGKKIQVNYF